MPLYEYECSRCGHRFELLQKFSDKRRKRCPECRGAVERLISPPAIRFKGTGWYVTDYANKGKAAEKAEKAEKESAGDGAKEAGGGKESAAAKKPDGGETPGKKPS